MSNVKPVTFVHKVIDPQPAGTFNDVTLLFDVNGDSFPDIFAGEMRLGRYLGTLRLLI
ncbi:MAG: hypothetical protein ACOC95_09625 [Planctomycetota bacterium]